MREAYIARTSSIGVVKVQMLRSKLVTILLMKGMDSADFVLILELVSSRTRIERNSCVHG